MAASASRKGESDFAVSLSAPPPTTTAAEGEPSVEKKGEPSPSYPPARLPSRNASSKYDFVKVKVWLGDNADHYYVLSRFLLSRMLTVTKIPNHVAIKIALELKKLLVFNMNICSNNSPLMAWDSATATPFVMVGHLLAALTLTQASGNSKLRHNCSQSDLETNLFKLMLRRGYGEEYINRYKMMTRQVSSPKSTTGLAGDLKKAMKDGKPIIIEGIHLDPSIYLMEEENKDSHTKDRESGTSVEDSAKPVENILDNATEQSQSASVNDAENTMSYSVTEGTVDERDVSQTEVPDCSRATSVAEIASGPQGEVHKDSELQSSSSYKKEKSATEPIIVPIVLKMSEFDHKALLEEWITTRTVKDKCLVQDQNKLISNLKIIQEYLCSFESQGMTVVNISATTFPQTLDRLHSYLLQLCNIAYSFALISLAYLPCDRGQ
ncbi:2-Phosphoglycerate kinase [Musa troglodytarum]|uniref:2-Phosphoglycerate kinase n=1 Tax=Musa troglodytarum TaxID=320322 RepID=A0A9E7HTE7_9LILI|nr:2-Phosphoglycerate kinase [Musa troglodytarum]